MFRIDRCLVYIGYINKDFLHWDLIESLVHTGLCFIRGSVLTDFTVSEITETFESKLALNVSFLFCHFQCVFFYVDHMITTGTATNNQSKLPLQLKQKVDKTQWENTSCYSILFQITCCMKQ